MENADGEVEYMVALPDNAEDGPASWSCFAFLSGTHFHVPIPAGVREWEAEAGGRR